MMIDVMKTSSSTFLEEQIFSDFIASDEIDISLDGLISEVSEMKNKYPSHNRTNVGGYQSPTFGSYIVRGENTCIEEDNTLVDFIKLKEIVIDFAQDYMVARNNILITSSTYNWWLNCNHYGHFNQIHTHRKTDLVGLFYIKTPPNSGKLKLIRNDGSQYSAIYRNTEYHLTPEEGRCYLFPGHLWHMVEPHGSDEERISVSFNMYVD